MLKKRLGCLALLAGGIWMASSLWIARADQGSASPGGPPFPNDIGPSKVDISKYPPDMQADYNIFARRCSECHSLARAINSQNLQLTADEQKTALAQDPPLFQNSQIWLINDSVWSSYVHKMYDKPKWTFELKPTEVDAVIQFLVYDSKVRKMGANRDDWREQRLKLLKQFKKSNPKRYAELFGK